METASLVSSTNVVEAPFIVATIGGVSFGCCSDMSNGQRISGSVTYPNYMKSIRIVKINGALNTYTLTMEYPITERDDPNLIEYAFSAASKSREITLSYGDGCNHMFKDEVALITKVTSNIDFSNSKIVYNISATSKALSLTAGSFSFPPRLSKPSDCIKELINNVAYGLSTIFTGMRGSAISNLIAGNDKKVRIEAKKATNVLDYTNYLVSCMENQNEPANSTIKKSNYHMAVYDDTTNKYGGTYFKVAEIPSGSSSDMSTYDTYEVDIGYPTNSYVMGFSIETDNTWSILYDYSSSIQLPQYTYSINDTGNVVSSSSPALTKSSTYLRTTASAKSWWTEVTQFPVRATLILKGLLRPTILMSYVKVNSYFYGRKHISSGLYIITRQEDSIDASGYRTTLSLTRIDG